MKMKGVSPIISSVILILIVISLATVIAPWAYNLVTNTTKNIDPTSDIECQNAAFDFITSYGTYGVMWNFTDQGHNLNVSIRNTGTISLYNFYFEIRHNTTNITHWSATSGSQKTSSNPLKPSESCILVADITQDLNGTLNEVTILNDVCPGVSITNDNF